MSNLFIVHTPYHLILATGIVKYNKLYKSDILIYKDFDLSNIDIENIKSIFDNVYIYDKNKYVNNCTSKLKTIFITRNKIKSINKLIKNKYNKMFVFNESLIETQFILNKKLTNKIGEIIYVEDGSNAYTKTPAVVQNNSVKNILRDYLIYGFRYEHIGHTFGIHSKIQKRMIVWPRIVREELKKDGIPLEEISKDILTYGIKCCYENQITKIDKNENKILILLEHEEFFSMNEDMSIDKYREVIKNIIDELNLRHIYIKYHPRDNSNYLKDIICNYENVKLIPSNQAAEVYYISDDISIVSVFSTTLFTAAKILPTMKIISLANIMNIRNEDLKEKLKYIGVSIPNEFNDLVKIINN